MKIQYTAAIAALHGCPIELAIISEEIGSKTSIVQFLPVFQQKGKLVFLIAGIKYIEVDNCVGKGNSLI